ncbi:MAG: polymer-forming cytoskeletal protein [Polaromonas sp.]
MSNKTPYIQHYPSSSQDAEQPDSSLPSESGMSTNPSMPNAVNVAVGTALPSSAALKLPTLKTEASTAVPPDASGERQSLIAEGVNFVGNAQLSGVCSVGGKVEGNLVQSPGHSITVIVTESGYVKGDIVASNISIMGQTDGLLDATGGSVTLHDASRVSGHVRYNRLQVNGADLNATLEKAAGSAGTGAPRNFGSGL